MPEFMTNLRAACHLLRGAVKNSDLPKPEFFRKAAALTNEGLFECPNNEDENDLEACISKGDAAYESAWIDKLLKDSDDSQSETDDHLDRRKSSAADEALSIRKGDSYLQLLFCYLIFCFSIFLSVISIFFHFNVANTCVFRSCCCIS